MDRFMRVFTRAVTTLRNGDRQWLAPLLAGRRPAVAAVVVGLLAATVHAAVTAESQHQRFFSNPAMTRDCTVCHRIDAQGQLVSNMTKKVGPKVPKELLEQLTPIYREWYQAKRMPRMVKADVDCLDCHGTWVPQPGLAKVGNDKCSNCHGGYDKLKAKTANLKPNPHEPQQGKDAPCSQCHNPHSDAAAQRT